MIILLLILFLLCLLLIIAYIILLKKLYRLNIKHKEDIKKERALAVTKSKDVIRGNITQEFIPLFPDFPYNMSDIKFSGQPLDYLVFKNMTDFRNGKDIEIEIIFADVKTNKSQRNKVQNAIKKAIEEKRVKFETWTIVENRKLNIK